VETRNSRCFLGQVPLCTGHRKVFLQNGPVNFFRSVGRRRILHADAAVRWKKCRQLCLPGEFRIRGHSNFTSLPRNMRKVPADLQPVRGGDRPLSITIWESAPRCDLPRYVVNCGKGLPRRNLLAAVPTQHENGQSPARIASPASAVYETPAGFCEQTKICSSASLVDWHAARIEFVDALLSSR